MGTNVSTGNRRSVTPLRCLACAVTLLAAAAVAETNGGPATPNEVRQRVVLVGDAGWPGRADELLHAVREFIEGETVARTSLVFLGDNVYARGNRIEGAAGARALDLQLEAGREAAEVTFVPGNHDWESGPVEEAVSKLVNEQRYIEDPSRPTQGAMLPQAGCPGPAARELDGLKVIALDSAWWFRDARARSAWSAKAGCPQFTEEQVERALAAELRCDGEPPCVPRLVVAHHPLETYGSHGGWFPWHEHFLCHNGLPLPILCSAYVVARQWGVAAQDLSSSVYRHFVARVGAAMAADPPLLYAAGHEHALQVLRGPVAHVTVVSGAGMEAQHVGEGERTLFAAGERGFAVADVLADGGALLRVYVLRDGEARVADERHVAARREVF